MNLPELSVFSTPRAKAGGEFNVFGAGHWGYLGYLGWKKRAQGTSDYFELFELFEPFELLTFHFSLFTDNWKPMTASSPPAFLSLQIKDNSEGLVNTAHIFRG